MDHHAHHGHHSFQTEAPKTDPPMMHHESHAMNMAFTLNLKETILINEWKTETVGGLLASMFVVFVMSVLYEGLKYYRVVITNKKNMTVKYKQTPRTDKDETDSGAIETVVEKMKVPKLFSMINIYRTSLYIMQTVLSYLLMLIVMTYNFWLFISVLTGVAFGHFFFQYKAPNKQDLSDACH